MQLARPSIIVPVLPLALVLAGTACHDGSSSPAPAETPASVSNLGLATSAILGAGELRLVVVSEAEQGRDLNGDGDLLDGGFVGPAAYGVVHVVDLPQSGVENTGLVLAVTRPGSIEVQPEMVAAAGSSTLAFGVDESLTGGLDRNGDGDAEDFVLALRERAAGVVNLGLAVGRVVLAEPILAFDVPEQAQGEDLDGDGTLGSGSVPFVHDLRTGETWSTGLRGRSVLGVNGAEHGGEPVFVALAADETMLGDRNGDGDSADVVFEVYDATARTLQPAGLALLRAIGGLASPPLVHQGLWAFSVGEQDQGRDLDGDGDALDVVSIVYDPESARTLALGPLQVAPLQGLAQLVLFELDAGSSGFPTVWLHDARTDQLASTGLRGVNVARAGQRVAIQVSEDAQGEDLDHDGAFTSFVPVLYDFRTDRRESLGLDAFFLQPSERGLLMRARESARDWNGDGDRDDVVLFTWREGRGTTNTGLAIASATWLDEATALVTLRESDLGADLNQDGDELDRILHEYTVATGRLTSLGLAAGLPLQGGGGKILVTVLESSQGQDLNQDGDRDDAVLHLVEE